MHCQLTLTKINKYCVLLTQKVSLQLRQQKWFTILQTNNHKASLNINVFLFLLYFYRYKRKINQRGQSPCLHQTPQILPSSLPFSLPLKSKHANVKSHIFHKLSRLFLTSDTKYFITGANQPTSAI